MLPWTILGHRLATGFFSGMSLSVSLMTVPGLRKTSDPLPAWKACYEGGKNFSIATTLVACSTGVYNYYQTGNGIFLLSTGLQFATMPFTIFVMLPGIKKLYTLNKSDDREIRKEMEDWAGLHLVRILFGLGAFVTVLLSDQIKI